MISQHKIACRVVIQVPQTRLSTANNNAQSAGPRQNIQCFSNTKITEKVKISVSSLTREDPGLQLDGSVQTVQDEQVNIQSGNDSQETTNFTSSASKGRDSLTKTLIGMRWSISRFVNVPKRIKGLVYLNLLTILMSTNWVIVKNVQEGMDPFSFTSVRFLLAAMAFVPVLPNAFSNRKTTQAGLELGLWSALGYITQGLALVTTDASRASFLSTFTVILVPILGGITGKGVSKQTWAGAFMAIFGMALLETGGSPPCVGDIWGVLSAAFFAVQMLRTEHHSRNIARDQTFPMMGIVVSTVAITAIGASLVTHSSDAMYYATHLDTLPAVLSELHIPIVPLLFTSLLSTDLVLLLEILAMQYVSSLDAAIVYSLEPVLGAGLAWYTLGERWGPQGWVGAAIIVASSLAVQVFGTETTESEEKES